MNKQLEKASKVSLEKMKRETKADKTKHLLLEINQDATFKKGDVVVFSKSNTIGNCLTKIDLLMHFSGLDLLKE